ncbi:MAG: N-6 DNA methylase [Eubacterium sp.]
MELLEFKNKIFDMFECENFEELPSKILNGGYTADIFDKYLNIVGNLDKDWIKHLFQYYQADRVNKKQDFTPNCLSLLLSRLSGGGNTIYDCCAGTGSLTIEKWNNAPDALYICEELDENAIPFLLFNLAIRNINAYVINGNVLTGDKNTQYSITKGDKYEIVKQENLPLPKCVDVSISNPPYNISWMPPTALEALTDERFNKCELPPKGNANYAFILHCFSFAKKSCFILPNGILKSDGTEREIRKYLIDNNFVHSVIILPDKMFEVTTISTCILVLDKNKKNDNVAFIDARQRYSLEIREQNGQYGGKSHTKRTYLKEYKTFNDEQIESILNVISSGENIPEFCITVTNEQIQNMNYDISPSTYIQFKERENQHRSYDDIISDLNFVNRQRNSCKLIINENLAKHFDISVDLFKESKRTSLEQSENIKNLLGLKLETEDYISFSKNKNEICIKTNDKDILSSLFGRFIKMWGQNIELLNNFENRYLAELRDALLPDLMNGKIDVSDVKE